MVALTGIFLDDREVEEAYARRLSVPGDDGLTVEFRLLDPDTSVTGIAAEILLARPALLALDYRLDEIPGENQFKAGTLAQHIREKIIDEPEADFPIILITNENNYYQYVQKDLTARDLFDQIYLKRQVTQPEEGVNTQALSLARGYKRLIGDSWAADGDRLRLGLCLEKDETWVIDDNSLSELNTLPLPHQFVSGLFDRLINRPGPLLDRRDLFAVLGISEPDEPQESNLCKHLTERNILYTGLFSDGWPRWWVHRLDEFGKEFSDQPLIDISGKERTAKLSDVLQIDLAPAISRWTESSDEPFAFACASCASPTEPDHSVPAFDPSPYPFVRKKSICWKCVQTGEFEAEEKNLQIDESGRYIADKIMAGELVPPEGEE